MASPLHGHEFEQVLGDGEGQGSLARSSPCGLKEFDSTERLKNNTLIFCYNGLEFPAPLPPGNFTLDAKHQISLACLIFFYP